MLWMLYSSSDISCQSSLSSLSSVILGCLEILRGAGGGEEGGDEELMRGGVDREDREMDDRDRGGGGDSGGCGGSLCSMILIYASNSEIFVNCSLDTFSNISR